jgi:hypothetical protein
LLPDAAVVAAAEALLNVADELLHPAAAANVQTASALVGIAVDDPGCQSNANMSPL